MGAAKSQELTTTSKFGTGNSEQDEQTRDDRLRALIDAVRRTPGLYNFHSGDYFRHGNDVKDGRLWENIARTLRGAGQNRTTIVQQTVYLMKLTRFILLCAKPYGLADCAGEVKRSWRELWDRFTRERRRVLRVGKTSWKFYDDLKFLLPYLILRRNTNGIK